MKMAGDKMHCGFCGGHGIGLFCTLDKPYQQRLNLQKSVQKYDPGQHLFDEGEPSFALFCIHAGRVKVYKIGEKGERQVIRLLGPGDIVGFRGLLANEPYAATAEAVEKTTTCLIPGEAFHDLLRSSPDLMFRLMSKLAEELRVSEEQMLALLHHPVKQRAASLLLTLIDSRDIGTGDNNRLRIIPLRRIELAQIIGTTPETLSRSLREFADRGIISVTYKEIHIIKLRALEKIARKKLGHT